MLEKLIELNNKILNNTHDKEKHLLIKKILEDKQCFQKMNIETAYAILRELNIPEQELKDIYIELVMPSNNI